MYTFSTLVACAGLVQLSVAGYYLQDDYNPGNWLNMFHFETENDPTGGYVNYVDQGTAINTGLFNTNNNQIYMGVDHTNIASGRGRSSTRMVSNKAYTHGLVVLDLAHMPSSICGTWPAFWMVGGNWPYNGEIDIIEGVNDQTGNDLTLHTGPGCAITQQPMFGTSHVNTYDCNVYDPNQPSNAGCGIQDSDWASYGTGFNNNGGGVYAMEWTSQAIKIWFWPHGPAPGDVYGPSPNPANWGAPRAAFAGSGCNIDQSFSNNNIVFDNTFCGAWAGNVWPYVGQCAAKHGSSCTNYVQNNPNDFHDAYWAVNSLRVYQSNGQKAAAAASTAQSTNAAMPVQGPVQAPKNATATTAHPATTKFVAPSATETTPKPVTVTAMNVNSAGQVQTHAKRDEETMRRKRHIAGHVRDFKGHHRV